MTRRVVWIVNHYFAERARDGRTSRHEQLAIGLADHGWHTVLIGASTVHPTGTQTFGSIGIRRVARVATHTVVRLRGVAYSGPTARIADMALFTMLLLLPGSCRGLPRPEVVIGSSFHPVAAWAASLVAKRCGARFVYEPRDLWPETLLAFTGRSERSWSVRLLRAIERRIIKRADSIVSPLAGAGEYYEARGTGRAFTWVSNGTERANAMDAVEPPQESDTHGRPFVVAYLGSIGRANALEAVVDALASPALAEAGVVLRMVGDGPAVGSLRERAGSLGISDRIEFVGRVPQTEARAIGRASDCLILNMQHLPLYRWGVSLNKIFEYAALGRPIVCGAGGPVPVLDAATAVIATPDDADALAAGIAQVVAMSAQERLELAERAASRLAADFTYDTLARRLAGALDATIDPACGGHRLSSSQEHVS